MSTEIRIALEKDLARVGITQDQLGSRLGITQQAIDKWCERNQVPRRRWPELAEVLGKDAEILKVAPFAMPALRATPVLLGTARVSRRVENVPPLPQASTLAQARVARPIDVQQEYATKLFMNLAREIPEAEQDVAVESGPFKYRFDIATPHQIIEVKPYRTVFHGQPLPSVSLLTVVKPLVNLAVIASVDTREKVLLLLDETRSFEQEHTIRAMERFRWEASQLHVSLIVAASVEEAAKQLSKREQALSEDALAYANPSEIYADYDDHSDAE